jgi:hypothetical protein
MNSQSPPKIVSLIFFVYRRFHYILAPLLTYSKQKIANTRFEHFPPNALPDEIGGSSSPSMQSLADHGFSVVDYLVSPKTMPSIIPVVVYLVNRSTSEKAILSAMCVELHGVLKLMSVFIEYTTRFSDDTWISTNNNIEATAFKPVPNCETLRFAGLNDLNLIHSLHQHIVNKYARKRRKVLPEPGREIEEFESRSTNR